MSGIFGGGTADKYNNKQAKMIKDQQNKALDQIDLRKATQGLDAEYKRLQDGGGFRPVSYTGPGHNIGISSTGAISMNRTPEAQGFMDQLMNGLGTDESGFSNLLSQIAPGFGKLSTARGQEIDNAREKAVGNLREQLAKRRVLGASFANDQIGSLERQYMQDKDAALADSITKEMDMTNQVLQARTQARNQTITTGLNEIQFESNIGAQLLQTTSANMQNLQSAMTDLVKLKATIIGQGQIAKGNISANLGNTGIAAQTDFANLDSQEQAAPGQLLGTILGAGLGGWATGGFSGIGNLFGTAGAGGGG